MSFNENLLSARKEKNMSQEELAQYVGVTRQAVSKWETGECFPDIFKLSALADALDTSIDSLCGRQPSAVSTKDTLSPPRQNFPRWKKVVSVFAAAALLTASFFAGAYTSGLTAPDPAAAAQQPLPEVITVSGTSFSGRGRKLSYQFIPSVTGGQYTYQISFLGNIYGNSTYDVLCRDGVCAGEVSLNPGEKYTVSVIISKDGESRVVCLATDLQMDPTGLSWAPQ